MVFQFFEGIPTAPYSTFWVDVIPNGTHPPIADQVAWNKMFLRTTQSQEATKVAMRFLQLDLHKRCLISTISTRRFSLFDTSISIIFLRGKKLCRLRRLTISSIFGETMHKDDSQRRLFLLLSHFGMWHILG